jgi:glycerophosphoryl diester phosphodiesterase
LTAEPSSQARDVEIIAHRGYSARAPENTVVAMELALDAGADALEFDLHTSKDGTAMLFHDATLDRTTDGVGPISAWSDERLAALDAGAWFDAAFSGEPIPTLAQALERVGPRVGRLYAEVKGYNEPEELQRMVETVTAAGCRESTVFISMDWSALERIRATDSGIAIGYIVERSERAAEATARATGDPAALLDFNAEVLLDDPSLARSARDRGIELASWTVDAPGVAARLLRIGVRGITTNEVGVLMEWKATL